MDQAFFESIYYQHYDKLFTAFLKKTRSEVVAQELTQITFIKLWEYRHTFLLDLPAELQINRKAKLVWIDWLRKESHIRAYLSHLKTLPTSVSVQSQLENSDSLNIAIDQLSAMRKKVFIMAYVEGFTYKEISDQLSISVKTVDAHLQAALKQLRAHIGWLSLVAFVVMPV
jgi:RNA polymerase sigma-70 factor (ECF subfamily)